MTKIRIYDLPLLIKENSSKILGLTYNLGKGKIFDQRVRFSTFTKTGCVVFNVLHTSITSSVLCLNLSTIVQLRVNQEIFNVEI